MCCLCVENVLVNTRSCSQPQRVSLSSISGSTSSVVIPCTEKIMSGSGFNGGHFDRIGELQMIFSNRSKHMDVQVPAP